MVRKVFAVLAFNVYAWCIVWAFQANTAYQFDADMIRRLSGTGFDTPPTQWGWGNHYIWRVLAAVIATALAGVLAGGLARTRAGLTAAIANIPSIAISGALIYWFVTENTATVYGDQHITTHTGMIVSLLVGIPLTTYLAYVSGEGGAKIQHDEFEDGTVFGIAGYHWIWFAIPTYLYAFASVNPIMNFFTFNFLSGDMTIVGGLIGLALFGTAIASVLPLVWVYLRLRQPAKTVAESVRHALRNFGILIVGFVAVGLVQLASHWLLGKTTPISQGVHRLLINGGG